MAWEGHYWLSFSCRYIFIRTEEQQALAGKTAIGLFSPSAFTFASDLFGAYEAGGQGLGWKDLWDDGFPIGAVMLLLYFDTLLYRQVVLAVILTM